MNIIYPLAIIAVILAGFFLIAFLYALNTGQFDDPDTHPRRILLDEESDFITQETNIFIFL